MNRLGPGVLWGRGAPAAFSWEERDEGVASPMHSLLGGAMICVENAAQGFDATVGEAAGAVGDVVVGVAAGASKTAWLRPLEVANQAS